MKPFPRSRPVGEGGNAMVEFTWLAILLMVPLVYLMLTVFQVQKAAYAVEAGSREAGRAAVTADNGEDPRARADAAAQLAASDQDVHLSARQITVTCEPASHEGTTPSVSTAGQQDCLTPGNAVHVHITTQVPLPFLPKVLFGRYPASVKVEATHVEVVDKYRDSPAGRGRP